MILGVIDDNALTVMTKTPQVLNLTHGSVFSLARITLLQLFPIFCS